MTLKDIVPEVNSSDCWGQNYQHYVPLFINYAREHIHINEWEPDVRDQLFRSVNCISSLRQGNFYISEREIIMQHWNELMVPLAYIAEKQDDFCIKECYEVINIIKKYIKANRPAASLRFIAAFQPAQLTTVVTWYFLDDIYNSLKKAGLEIPEGYGGDAIQKSHYLQLYFNASYPDVDPISRGTYAWRIPELIQKAKQVPPIITQGHPDNQVPTIIAGIKSITEIIALPLRIPSYQRPYVWSTNHVEQLLSDIKDSMEHGKRAYRIGSIILHNNDIVDGQQRLTTICIIKHALSQMMDLPVLDGIGTFTYSHELSFAHINENFEYIKRWLAKLPENRRLEFISYLDKNCEFVVVKVSGKDSLSIAFKLFDSQNGRGKPLEAYNLLKAYHLRAMETADMSQKIKRDREWEQTARYGIETSEGMASYDILKHLFDEQLYRTRMWCRNGEAWTFSKKTINEFKGMQIDKRHAVDYPFQNKELLLFMTEKFYHTFLRDIMPTCSRFKSGDDTEISPFVSINQPIVNGNNFFEYIHSYAEIYKKLFLELDSYQLHDFKVFYKKNCLEYGGHWRTGDSYVRELYKSLIMLLFDKFGEEGVNQYHQHLYVLTYYLRKKNSRVYYATVAQYPAHLFAILENAKDTASLRKLEEMIFQQEYSDVLQDGYKKFTCYDDVLNLLTA